jgi:hypothetical protein
MESLEIENWCNDAVMVFPTTTMIFYGEFRSKTFFGLKIATICTFYHKNKNYRLGKQSN